MVLMTQQFPFAFVEVAMKCNEARQTLFDYIQRIDKILSQKESS